MCLPINFDNDIIVATLLKHSWQVFKRIENLLMERCTNSRPPCREVKKLFDKEQLEAYEPYGEEGPKVDLLSSISLVNRYCGHYYNIFFFSGLITMKPLIRYVRVYVISLNFNGMRG